MRGSHEGNHSGSKKRLSSGVPASLAAVSFYLIPVFGVATGFLFLGERLDPRQWVGAAIVLVALLLIIRRPANQPEPVAATVLPT